MLGIAAGLRVAGSAAGSGSAARTLPLLLGFAILLGVLIAVRARLAPAPLRRAHRTGVRLALLACLIAGSVLGIRAGTIAKGSCVRDLQAGDLVLVVGRLPATAAPVGAGRAGEKTTTSGRLTLRDVRIQRGGRVCAVSRLSVPVAGAEPVAGARGVVRVTGAWVAFAPTRGAWPRAPERLGLVRVGRGREAGGPESAAGPRLAPARPGLTRRWSRRMRAAAAARLRARLAPDVRGMGIALVLADRDGLAPSARKSFAEAGVSHLLAISGLHVGIIAVVATWLASLAFPTRRFEIGAGVVVAYVALIGAPPAALRASLLFAGYGLARSRGAPAALGDLLGAAAIVTLLIDPMDLLDPGFQLSFAGFTGLGIGGAAGRAGLRRLAARRRTRRTLRSAALAVAASTGAFSLTAPIAAAHFERVAPVAILGSLAGAPLVALALCGLLGAIVLPGIAGELAGAGATVALRSLSGLAAIAGEIPFGHANVTPPGALTWLLAAGLGAAVLAGIATGSRTPIVTGLTAAAGVWALTPGIRRLEIRDETLLCTLDVGQGDAAVVRTRRGAWLVLDAGPPGRRGSSRGVVRFLRSHGARRIEALVLTHPHADHIGGAAELLEAFRVERVLDGGNPVPEPAYARLLDEALDRGVEWSVARSGALLRLDEVSVRILGPAAMSVTAGGPAVGANEGSVALRLTAGPGFAYVSTGDAYVAQERALLERWPADSVRADVLKIGHHGSRTSTSLAWLRTVRPSIVAISVGAGNRYGHPHPEALAVLDSVPVTTRWRTDRDGTLCLEIDEHGGWRILPP